jgi:hypothetical protein
MLALALTLAARAHDAVALRIRPTGEVGGDVPALVLVPLEDATSLSVSLDCGGTRLSRAGKAAAGVEIELALRVPAGTWTCRGSLEGAFADGSTGDMPLEFEVSMLAPWKLEVPPDTLDLARHRLSVVSSRPLRTIDVAVTGLGQARLAEASLEVAGQASPVAVPWPPTSAEILRIVLVVRDVAGYAQEITLRPWHYAIPHQDVGFATDEARVTPEEEPKLAEALPRIQAVFDKYGGDVPVINLYVAGYTDTVGSTAHNDQLSQMRAAALAAWFRAHGFAGKVWYQGFGERALAVDTPDGTDEPANRRAAYVLGSDAPTGEQFPGAAWRQAK